MGLHLYECANSFRSGGTWDEAGGLAICHSICADFPNFRFERTLALRIQVVDVDTGTKHVSQKNMKPLSSSTLVELENSNKKDCNLANRNAPLSRNISASKYTTTTATHQQQSQHSFFNCFNCTFITAYSSTNSRTCEIIKQGAINLST